MEIIAFGFKFLMTFVPKGPNDSELALVQVMG